MNKICKNTVYKVNTVCKNIAYKMSIVYKNAMFEMSTVCKMTICKTKENMKIVYNNMSYSFPLHV